MSFNNLIYYKDLDNAEVYELFMHIKAKNEGLYSLITVNLEQNNSACIKMEVLKYIADNINSFNVDMDYLFRITDVICNPKADVEHISFINKYYNDSDTQKFSYDDFGVVFDSCLEKNISIDMIRKLFDENTDIYEIYDKVDKYGSSEYAQYPESDLQDTYEEIHAEQFTVDKKSEYIPDVQIVSEKNNSSDVEIFNNLITVMTLQDKETSESFINMQRCISDIILKYQNATSSLSSYSADVLNSMKKDKEEIKRLNATITLLQKLLSQKQNDINSLRGEVTRLNEKIRQSEKAELRRDTLYQKINEVYRLTSGTEQFMEN